MATQLGDRGLRELERRATGDPEAEGRLNREYARRRLWDKWAPPSLVRVAKLMRPNRQDYNRQRCWDEFPVAEVLARVPYHLRDSRTGDMSGRMALRLNSWARLEFGDWDERNARACWRLGFRWGAGLGVDPGNDGHYAPGLASLGRIFGRLGRIYEKEQARLADKAKADAKRADALTRRDELGVALALAGVPARIHSEGEQSVFVHGLRLRSEGELVEVRFRLAATCMLTLEGATRLARVLDEEIAAAAEKAVDA